MPAGWERANNFGGQGLTTFTVRGFTTGEVSHPKRLSDQPRLSQHAHANTIERLEVLRGPATMLYGRGDPGGTFNVVSETASGRAHRHAGQPNSMTREEA